MVAGLRSQLGAGNAVLRLVAKRRLVTLATPPLFLEHEDVLAQWLGAERVGVVETAADCFKKRAGKATGGISRVDRVILHSGNSSGEFEN